MVVGSSRKDAAISFRLEPELKAVLEQAAQRDESLHVSRIRGERHVGTYIRAILVNHLNEVGFLDDEDFKYI